MISSFGELSGNTDEDGEDGDSGGEGANDKTTSLIMYAVGGILTVAVLFIISYYSKKALDDAIEKGNVTVIPTNTRGSSISENPEQEMVKDNDNFTNIVDVAIVPAGAIEKLI